jgi:hypothetical protein
MDAGEFLNTSERCRWARRWPIFPNTRPASDLVSIDFFTVPTVTLRVLFVFIVLEHAEIKMEDQKS